MQRITRERPKIERIACPWPIAQFLDTAPEFRFVAADQDWPSRERPLLFPMASWSVRAQPHDDVESLAAIGRRSIICTPPTRRSRSGRP